MPFSQDNPNRNRNFVILVLAGVSIFGIIMAGYVVLSLGARDTDAYVRFLTLLVTGGVPSILSAWYSYNARRSSQSVHEEILENGTHTHRKEGT